MWGAGARGSLRSRFLLPWLVLGAFGLAGPLPAAACSGGTAPDWAVAHQHGGILRGVVLTADTRSDFTTDLVLANLERLAGAPPSFPQVNSVAGAVCDQSADPGDTVVVIFDIRGGEVEYPLPLFYVVRGPDALEPAVVAALFGPPAPAAIPSVGGRASLVPGAPPDVSDARASSPILPIAIALAIAGGLALLLVGTRRRHTR
jgi:hypothetical protein